MATVTSLKMDISSQFDPKGMDDAKAKLKEMQAQLDELRNKKLDIQADTSDVNLKIAETKRDIDSMNTRLQLNADDTLALGAIDRLKEKLAGLQEEKINLRIDALQAQAEIDKIKLEMDDLKAKMDKNKLKLNLDTSPMRQELDRAKTDVDNATKSMQNSFQNAGSAGQKAMLNLVSAAILLAPALVPLAGAALLTGGALVSAFTGAGAAAGVFGLALGATLKEGLGVAKNADQLNTQLNSQKAVLSTLTPGSAAYKAQLAQINQTQTQLNATLNAQGPVVRQVAEQIMSLQDQWKHYQAVTASAVSPYINSILNAISQTMKAMVPIVDAVTTALQPMRQQFDAFFTAANGKDMGAGLQHVVDWIATVGVRDLQLFVNILHNLIVTFGQIVQAFSSQGVSVLQWLEATTAQLDKWGANGGFQRFAQYVQANMPTISHSLESMGQAIQHIVVALAGMGGPSLTTLSIVSNLLAHLPVGVVQAFFVAFAGYKVISLAAASIEGVVGSFKAIDMAIKVARLSMIAFTAAQAGNTVVAEENSAAQVAVKIGTLASAVATGVATAAQWAWNAAMTVADAVGAPVVLVIGAIVAAVAALGFGIYELVKHWSTVWGEIKRIAADVWGFLQSKWGWLMALFAPPIGILVALIAHWKEVWGAIKEAASAIWQFLKGAWSDFIDTMKKIWDTVSGALKSAWNATWNGLKSAAQAVWDALKAAWEAVINALKAAWDTVSSALKSAWDAVWNALKSSAQAVWDGLKAAWSSVLNAVKSAWDTVSAALRSAWDTFWNALKAAGQAVWDAIRAAWEAVLAAIRKAWDTVSSALRSAWDSFWNALKSAGQAVWDAIKSAWEGILNGIKSAWDTVSNTLKSAWSKVWNDIKGTASQIWGDIKSAADQAWKDIANAFVKPVNFVIDTVWNHGIAAVWNDTAGALGLGKLPTEVKIPNFAGGGYVRGPGGPKEDKVPAWLSDTEFVVQSDAVKKYGVGFMHDLNQMRFATGGLVERYPGQRLAGGDTGAGSTAQGVQTGGSGVANDNAAQNAVATANAGGNAATIAASTYAVSNLNPIAFAQSLASFVNKVTGGLLGDAMKAAIHALIDPLIGAVPVPGKFDMKKPANTLLDKAIDKMVNAQQAKIAASTAVIGGTIPTGSRLQIIDAALSADGIPQSDWPVWEAGLNTLITRESNWDPNAINNSDSNAAAGTPSEGLAQVIAPTFAAYRNPSLPNNLLDPVANVAAAINYIKAVYGSITNVQQANANLPPKGYDMGGALMPGYTLAHNTTGVMEGVLNPIGLSAVGGLEGLHALNSGRMRYAEPSSSVHADHHGHNRRHHGDVHVHIECPIEVNEAQDGRDIIDRVENELLPKIVVAIEQGVGARG